MLLSGKENQVLGGAVSTEAHVWEEEILKLSGLKLYSELHIFDVPINFGESNYIHTYKSGNQNKETLVLLHGYGGCSVLYYPMLKELSKKYRVFCIDFLGMGLSSRPEFKCNSTQETIDFFVESIEKWRESLDIRSFYLGGHSFGGYMSIHYSLKYQNRVKKLFLLSPVGITKPINPMSREEFAKSLPWLRRQMFSKIMSFWDSQTSINEYFREHPIIGGFLLKMYLKRQFGSLGKEEKIVEILLKFFTALFKIEGGSDKSVFLILHPPRANALVPLEDLIFEELKIPIVCYYGDNDWMDSTGSRRIVEKGKKNFEIKIIPNSGHAITMHNPLCLAGDLLEEIIP